MYYSKRTCGKKILSLPAIIAVVGTYIAIFELNLIGVTSLLLYIYHRHNNLGICKVLHPKSRIHLISIFNQNFNILIIFEMYKCYY